MFNKRDSDPVNGAQSELPTRTPASTDRRPTVLHNSLPNNRSLFGGWGPRLG